MAPELIEVSLNYYNLILKGFDYAEKVDIWSLGIVLIELCNKVPPLGGIHYLKALTLIMKNPPPKINQGLWSK